MPLHRSHHLHLPFLRVDNNKELRALYIMRVLRDLVNQSTFFFLPIFLGGGAADLEKTIFFVNSETL